MERKFDKEFKKDVMKMKVGEDWNKLKEKYGNISRYKWDKEMEDYLKEVFEQYSKDEDYRKILSKKGDK